MAWLRKHKFLLTGLIAAALALPLLASPKIEINSEPGDVSGLSCDRMKLEYADAQELTRLIDESGKGFVTFIEDHTADSFVDRLFFRLMFSLSGDREAAEKTAAEAHKTHMAALEKEIAARCT